MYFVFTGEGPTDFGTGHHNGLCESHNYTYGPMAFVVGQIVENEHGYSIIDIQCFGFVTKATLHGKAKPAARTKEGMRLVGKRRGKETGYFYKAARALALIAKEIAAQKGDDVVAVLFRDCDGTASAERGMWKNKWDSMTLGFEDESFTTGVPMLPKPISEAWLLCALKDNPYKDCNKLESRSPSPSARNPLKKQLSHILKGDSSRENLCNQFSDGRIDALRIDMDSFNAFRSRLEEVCKCISQNMGPT